MIALIKTETCREQAEAGNEVLVFTIALVCPALRTLRVESLI